MVADLGQRKRAGPESGSGVVVEVGVEQRMEAVDDAAVADGEAQLDHLLCIEVRTQVGEELIGDGRHARTCLGKAHDGGLGRTVDTFGERVLAQVGDLVVGQPDVSTETYVSRHSIVTVVGDRRRQIRKLSLVGTNVRGGRWLRAQMEERLEHIGMVGERAEHVDVAAGSLAQSQQQRASLGVSVGIVRIDERNTGHERNLEATRRGRPTQRFRRAFTRPPHLDRSVSVSRKTRHITG